MNNDFGGWWFCMHKCTEEVNLDFLKDKLSCSYKQNDELILMFAIVPYVT